MNEGVSGRYPRLVIAGASGDSGKTLVSLGLSLFARRRGAEVGAFKKGPDFIDAAWLSWASGRPARNLDTFLMGFATARSSFLRHGSPEGLNIIEGNRGLYDGLDASGTHSTAELAKALQAPVVLVLNATKVTRTAAALVLGCQTLDPDVRLGGVILNRVAGRRHERVLRDSVENVCGIPVLGAIPKIQGSTPLPGRHLGLLTPQEHAGLADLREDIARACSDHLDVQGLMDLATSSPRLAADTPGRSRANGNTPATIGYLSDSAFSFYYPENLEALEAEGARLVPISPLSGRSVPEDLDALYIGGGFPETHAGDLSENRAWLEDLRRLVGNGLPVYAECGGLMFLSQAILWDNKRYSMAGVLPFEVEVLRAPQGHGYTELVVDAPNPFFPEGTRLKGHEFHYSRIVDSCAPPATVCRVERGTGCFPGRDGVVQGNVWASYTHLHALASPEWAPALVDVAGRFAVKRKRR